VQRSNRPLWFEEPEELAELVRDEDNVSISGFHFTRAPIAQVRALYERGAWRLTYVAWGGGLPLEMLLAARSVRKLVFCRFDPQLGCLVLTRVHPGVTVEEVRENTGFPLLIAPELQETEPPTPRELRAIREEVDPLGIRRLEFVPRRERMALIEELLESEEEALAPLLGGAVEDPLDEHIA
jgi:hypothetical protein